MSRNRDWIITFPLSGRAKALYTEDINLRSLGALHIERATQIEFNNATQQWDVLNLDAKPLFSSVSREDCLDWEQLEYNHQTMKGECEPCSAFTK